MNYRINEIAKIYNISKEMIRYYERCGVISPQRNEENNYRMYSASDFFALGEAIQLTQFGVNIRNTKSMLGVDFVEQLVENYKGCKERLQEEIRYNEQLQKRCDDMIERLETSSLNLRSFWIKKLPERYTYEYQKSYKDEYGEIFAPLEICHWFLSAKYGVFSDTIVEFREDHEMWSFSIDKRYADILNPPGVNRIYKKPQICLCTVIDMGDFGEFTAEKGQPLLHHAEERGLRAVDHIHGMICGRGNKQGMYRRHMELRLPIEQQ